MLPDLHNVFPAGREGGGREGEGVIERDKEQAGGHALWGGGGGRKEERKEGIIDR